MDRRCAWGLVVLACGVAWSGCSEPDPEPAIVAVPPPLTPPPPPEDPALDREAVVDIATSQEDPGDAIARLDRQPFAFELDDETLDWFGQQGLEPAVLDYLGKRSKIDWASLRGDVDPEGPE